MDGTAAITSERRTSNKHHFKHLIQMFNYTTPKTSIIDFNLNDIATVYKMLQNKVVNIIDFLNEYENKINVILRRNNYAIYNMDHSNINKIPYKDISMLCNLIPERYEKLKENDQLLKEEELVLKEFADKENIAVEISLTNEIVSSVFLKQFNYNDFLNIHNALESLCKYFKINTQEDEYNVDLDIVLDFYKREPFNIFNTICSQLLNKDSAAAGKDNSGVDDGYNDAAATTTNLRFNIIDIVNQINVFLIFNELCNVNRILLHNNYIYSDDDINQQYNESVQALKTYFNKN
uniref:Uncharacterized protein n=1 Tax=Drosophila-associated filamentous virus TaxID=2743186 RepID=A0A6M9TZX0_9VIRU|nr:putative protein 15 [Drosophila-associated filamentous virus]